MKEHLTPEDYELARSHGVDYDNAYNRYYNLGWDKEKAITTTLHTVKPGRKRGIWYEYKELAERNQVSYSTFHYRIREGMHPSRAASIPPTTRGKIQREVRLYGKQSLPHA